jgi:DNA-nicking Smr family endonuclease
MAGLEALQQIKADLAAQAEREKAEKLAALLAARRLEAQRNMFANAVGKVQPLPATARVDLKQVAPAAAVLQHELDAQAALAESLSDEMDITSLLDTDAQLSFRRPGVGVDVVQKLRQGKWSIQRQVDLHGQRSDEARETLSRFIRDAHKQGLRCVRVVHGKGLGSPGKAPVLKDKVQRWLVQKAEVIAFVQAPPHKGGAGAVLVLLQPVRSAKPAAPAPQPR